MLVIREIVQVAQRSLVLYSHQTIFGRHAVASTAMLRCCHITLEAYGKRNVEFHDEVCLELQHRYTHGYVPYYKL